MRKLVSFITAAALAVSLLAGCASAPPSSSNQSPNSGAPAEPKAVFKIGMIQHVEHPSLATIREALIEELSRLGLDGKVDIEYKNAQGDPANISTIVTQFVADGKDMLVPIATPSAQAAAAATKTIPIVFASVSDPITAGLVKDLSITDGNITGVSNPIPVDKIIEFGQQLTPGIKTLGVVYCNGETNSFSSVEKLRRYAADSGLTLVEATIANSSELRQAAQSLVGRVDAIFTPNDNVVATAMTTLSDVAIQAKLPLYVGADSLVADGGLATVGIDYAVLGRQTAALIKEIIEGKAIADAPVQSMTDFAKILNTDTAQKLGLTIPPALLEGAQLMGS